MLVFLMKKMMVFLLKIKMADLSATLKEQMEKEAELNQEIKDQLSNIGVNL